MRRRTLLAATLPLPALAQGPSQGSVGDFPNRPVRLICPYSAGGIADTVARIVQPKVGEHLGQSLVIENRTGASGAVGAAAAAQAPPDGYTLAMEGATTITSPLANKSLPLDYDMLVPITQLTSAPYVLGMRAGFPAQDLAGFLAEAKRRPGEVTFGTPGVADIGHLMGELPQAMAGVKMEHIPYRGGADVSRDIAAGRLDFLLHQREQPAAGAGIRPRQGDRRHRPGPPADLPGVPAIGEVVPGYDLTTWILVFCPAGTPEPIQARLSAAFRTPPRTRRRVPSWTGPAATRRWRAPRRPARCSAATRR